MNDIDVVKYTDIRFSKVTRSDLANYWYKYHNSADNPWFAICLKDSQKHIGNIKLGPINYLHSIACLSLFIGDRNSWGNGYATDAIRLISEWSFAHLKLFKLHAYIYAENVASAKAFKKAGFLVEAILKDEVYLSSGKRTDLLRVGLTCERWLKQTK